MSTTIYTYKIVDAISTAFNLPSIHIEDLSDQSLRKIPEDSKLFGNFGGLSPTSFKQGVIGRPLSQKEKDFLSKTKKEYWENWRKQNPDYKTKWKCNNYQKKGYAKNSECGKKNCEDNNYKLLTCPHCGKESNVGNSKRWHFDNCGNKNNFLRGADGRFINNSPKG